MPNVMAALRNIGAALCSTLTTRVPCSNAAKTRNPLKLVGVSQTRQQISAAAEVHHIVRTYGGDIDIAI